eukprot:CAMPEP_0167788184 /NCGR_PEP_ID=MMETSP0111_2-20121227/9881_1 /TAXON_ID=91324 /ORGANISM="Lotharella globosa, Strain CCCM811" /LENGTH=353 /DNA_ID=CAMNT_0007679997 /DNA_START=260 /DNA_END=1321 /DNA_ORIENTATION=+
MIVGREGRVTRDLTTAVAANLEIRSSAVNNLVKAGAGALPLVWTLYGTPAAGILAATLAFMKANNKRDEIPDHEVITPASSPSPSPPAAPSAVAAAPAAPATPVTPATPSAPAAALPTTETEAAEAVSPVPPTPVLATTATVEPVAEVIEEVKETVVQELPPPVMEEPKRKKKKAAPPPPPMEFVVPLDDLPPVGGRGAAGREALTQLSRRLDPIKELAYGKPRPKKKIFDFGETEELIFKTFDPLGGLKSIEAPQGEFTLDPLPGGTRKKKAQPGTNMWGKEVASEPDPYFDAQEQVGQILGKLDPVRELHESVEHDKATSSTRSSGSSESSTPSRAETRGGLFRLFRRKTE